MSLRFCTWLLLLLAQISSASAAEPIRLLVRADDLGNAQSTNEACVRAYREGVVRSVEIIVPGQWTPDAVRLIAAAPGIDVGLHLCLTSEWEGSKWRPLTAAPSLVDEFGYFPASRGQPKGSPRRTGFIDSGYDPREVEAELRAQVDSLKQHLASAGVPAKAFSHFSAHMGVADGPPDLRAITERLAKEHGMWALEKGLKSINDAKFLAAHAPTAAAKFREAETREAAVLEILEKLPPGDWMWITHPALDTPEIHGFSHPGNADVAVSRAADFRCVTSEKVKAVIQRRGIQLISYRDLVAKPE